MLYIDCYFLLNLAIDLLALLAAAKITSAPVKHWRMLSGALFGARWAVGAVFVDFIGLLPVEIAAFMGVAAIAFGTKRGFIRRAGAFLGICILFGGAAYALYFLISGGEGGITFKIVFPAAALCFGAVCFFIRRTASKGEIVEVSLRVCGRERRVRALRDTGMSLKDPINNRPVIILDEKEFLHLLPPDAAGLVMASEPAESLKRLGDTRIRDRCRLLSCRTVSGGGLLLAVRTDTVVINGHTEEGLLVAAAPVEISKEGAYSALVGVKT